ncbi:hypothetical protein DPMN_043091 [Dreissena polymorpha]|uniref:Uncharacterized protein n=1 Tax=Dreissena polymorpha TaxID=45954 RepID=A0A9D4D243_DREPO|nr:hypothetical protein DPMN_043091 [Dreissena polymorpha]
MRYRMARNYTFNYCCSILGDKNLALTWPLTLIDLTFKQEGVDLVSDLEARQSVPRLVPRRKQDIKEVDVTLLCDIGIRSGRLNDVITYKAFNQRV